MKCCSSANIETVFISCYPAVTESLSSLREIKANKLIIAAKHIISNEAEKELAKLLKGNKTLRQLEVMRFTFPSLLANWIWFG